MPAFGMFRAILGVEDRASAQLEAIRLNALHLNETAVTTAQNVERMGRSLLEPIEAGADYGPLTNQVTKLGEKIQALGEAGPITSNRLRDLGQQASILGSRAGDEGLASELELTNQAMTQLSATSRVAEDQLRKTGIRGFSFMADVSDETANSMRMVSAMAQGAMLSMAALQKNVIGVAFSLIFLQFSGALKLSLAFAALSAIGGIVFMQLKKIFEQRREAERLAAAFTIITRNTQAFELATERSEQIIGDLGLTEGLTEDFTKALTRAILIMRDRGIEPTNDMIKVFILAFAQARARLGDFGEALNSTESDFIRFLETGVPTFMGITTSMIELENRGTQAFAHLSRDSRVNLDKMIQAFKDSGDVGRQFVEDLRFDFENFKGEIDTLPPHVEQQLRQMVKFLDLSVEDFGLTVDEWQQRLEDAFGSIPNIAEEALGPNTGLQGYFERTGASLTTMVNQGLIDINRLEARLLTMNVVPFTDPALLGAGIPNYSSVSGRGLQQFGGFGGGMEGNYLPFGGGASGRSPTLNLHIDVHGNDFRGDPGDAGQLIAGDVIRAIQRSASIGFAPLT